MAYVCHNSGTKVSPIRDYRVWFNICDVYQDTLLKQSTRSKIFYSRVNNKYISNECRLEIRVDDMCKLLGSSSAPERLCFLDSLSHGRIPVIYSCIGNVVCKDGVYYIGSSFKESNMPNYKEFVPTLGNYEGVTYISNELLGSMYLFKSKAEGSGVSAKLWCVSMSDKGVPKLTGSAPYSCSRSFLYGDMGFVDKLLEGVCKFLDQSCLSIDRLYWADEFEDAKSYMVSTPSGEKLFIVGK